jgi:histidyl-tRNA synthetase
MRKANKVGAKRVVVIGDDEITNNQAVIKNMQDREEINISLDVKEFIKVIRQ